MTVLYFSSVTNNIKSLWMLKVRPVLFYFILFQTTWADCGNVEDLSTAILCTETDSDLFSVAMYHSPNSIATLVENDGSLLECKGV